MSRQSLSQWLQDATAAGVYRCASLLPFEAAVAGARLSVARINLQDVSDKAALLEAIASALAFPDWFGANWDALEDCLTDLAWRQPAIGEDPAPAGTVLLFERFESVPPDDLGVLIDILESAASFWAGRAVPFIAVFADPSHVLTLQEPPAGA